MKEIQSLHRVYSTNPILGVEFEVDDVPSAAEELVIENIQDDIDIVNEDEQSDAFAVSMSRRVYYSVFHKKGNLYSDCFIGNLYFLPPSYMYDAIYILILNINSHVTQLIKLAFSHIVSCVRDLIHIPCKLVTCSPDRSL